MATGIPRLRDTTQDALRSKPRSEEERNLRPQTRPAPSRPRPPPLPESGPTARGGTDARSLLAGKAAPTPRERWAGAEGPGFVLAASRGIGTLLPPRTPSPTPPRRLSPRPPVHRPDAASRQRRIRHACPRVAGLPRRSLPLTHGCEQAANSSTRTGGGRTSAPPRRGSHGVHGAARTRRSPGRRDQGGCAHNRSAAPARRCGDSGAGSPPSWARGGAPSPGPAGASRAADGHCHGGSEGPGGGPAQEPRDVTLRSREEPRNSLGGARNLRT